MIAIVVIAVLHMIAAYHFVPLKLIREDTAGYVRAMEFLRGDYSGADVPYNRLLTTPLMLYSSLAMSYFTGSLPYGMLAVNFILYFAIVIVFFKLALAIYKEIRAAFLSTLLFLFSYYFFRSAFSCLADVGGWFFFMLASLLAVKYYQEKSAKYFYLAILAASVGVLFKEFGALGMLTLGMLILFSEHSCLARIKKIALAAGLFLVLPVAYHVYFYLQYHYSYFNWYFSVQNDYGYTFGSSAYTFSNFIKVMGWLYLAGWPIFLWGLWQEKKHFDKERAKPLGAMLPASLSFFAWPAFVQRVAVVFLPWLSMIAGFGLAKFKNYLVVIIMIFYIIINYNIEFLLKAINLPF